MDPVKVKGMLDWPIPQNLKDVRSFLGFYNFYQWFIKGFATLAWPLNDLLKKEVPWEWTPVKQLTFETLKGRITQAPVLAMPDYEKPFELEVDVTNQGIGPQQTNTKPPCYKGNKCRTRPLGFPAGLGLDGLWETHAVTL